MSKAIEAAAASLRGRQTTDRPQTIDRPQTDYRQITDKITDRAQTDHRQTIDKSTDRLLAPWVNRLAWLLHVPKEHFGS